MELRKTGDVNSSNISSTHHENTLAAVRNTKARLNEESRVEGGVFHLGLSDVAEPLNAAVDKAVKSRA